MSRSAARVPRLERQRLLGRSQVLALVGYSGAAERTAYLQALAEDVLRARCTRDEAVAELLELSAPWMRKVVRAQLRRLPRGIDGHVTEHWMWTEWGAGVRRFDPERVATFPGYIALRLRMAVSAAAREDDPLPRRERARVTSFQRSAAAMVRTLGRQLDDAEEQRLRRDVWSGRAVATPAGTRPSALEVTGEPAAGGPDPLECVVRRSTAHGVRNVIGTSRSTTRDRVMSWLDGAHGHDHPPPQRLVASIPLAVRDLLAPWAETSAV